MPSSILGKFVLFVMAALVALFMLGGCAAKPVAEPFQAHWEFWLRPGEPTKACLPEEDVAKLREVLIRCPKQED